MVVQHFESILALRVITSCHRDVGCKSMQGHGFAGERVIAAAEEVFDLTHVADEPVFDLTHLPMDRPQAVTQKADPTSHVISNLSCTAQERHLERLQNIVGGRITQRQSVKVLL